MWVSELAHFFFIIIFCALTEEERCSNFTKMIQDTLSYNDVSIYQIGSVIGIYSRIGQTLKAFVNLIGLFKTI